MKMVLLLPQSVLCGLKPPNFDVLFQRLTNQTNHDRCECGGFVTERVENLTIQQINV